MTCVKPAGLFLSLSVIALLGVGCAGSKKVVEREPLESDIRVRTSSPIVGEVPPPPAGVQRMCWLEPQVTEEQKGPGLDSEGKWYHPSYKAVRLANSGRWVPCEEAGR